jgi:tetratricopeptide (TPR) repeat protein
VGCYRRAVEQALEANDFQAVLSYVERGLQCGATASMRGALCLAAAEAHRWRGENAEAEKCGLEALSLIEPSEDLWANAAGEIALASGRLGNHEYLVSVADQLHRLGTVKSGAQVTATARTAMHLYHAGRRDLADALVVALEADLPMAALVEPQVEAWRNRLLATQALFGGDLGMYLSRTDAASHRFELAGDVRNACQQRVSVGYASMQIGAFGEAERALQAALGVAERMGLANVVHYAKHNLGLALAHLDRLAAAEEVERAAIAGFVGQGNRRLEGASRIYLARILLMAGRVDDAREEAVAALPLVDEMPPLRAYALGVHAHVLLAADDANAALAAAAAAMEVIAALGGIDEGESLVRLAHPLALWPMNRADEAEAAIVAAADRLKERAARISDDGLRASFLGAVPENVRTLDLAAPWLADDRPLRSAKVTARGWPTVPRSPRQTPWS